MAFFHQGSEVFQGTVIWIYRRIIGNGIRTAFELFPFIHFAFYLHQVFYKYIAFGFAFLLSDRLRRHYPKYIHSQVLQLFDTR